MTNVEAIVAIALVTNREEFVHPSGNEKIVRTVISEEHSTIYTNDNRVIILKAQIPVSTNVSRMIWTEVPFRIPREPLSVKDFPSPVTNSPVNRNP